ncbi:alpha/beta fold hydrolase [Halorhabdus salina]|uniref:alpha/beta fold hydrolase n=1 Tax=Halorhabdus salina TaxID=2750670 RepID=UPI0015EE8448|nr:alpha/beta hydrolase family protein [Halorhabdus salina]
MIETIHRSVDRAQGHLAARLLPEASIDSTTEDLDQFTEQSPRNVHPEAVEPAPVSFGPSTGRFRTTRTQFRFPSPVTTAECNETVVGQRWRRAGDGDSKTAVVMLHGAWASGFWAERVLSGPLLDAGADVFVIAQPYHMERAPPESDYSGQQLFSGDIPRTIEGVIQATADTRALIGALHEQGYDHIGLSGISLGGNVAAQTLAFVDIERAVLTIPGVDLFETMCESAMAPLLRDKAIAHGFPEKRLRQAFEVITPIEFDDPATDPDDILALYGRYDEIAPPGPVRRLAETWGFGTRSFDVGHRTIALNMLSLRTSSASWLLEAP